MWPVTGNIDRSHMLRWLESVCQGVMKDLRPWRPHGLAASNMCLSSSPPSSRHHPHIICLLTFAFSKCASIQHHTVSDDQCRNQRKMSCGNCAFSNSYWPCFPFLMGWKQELKPVGDPLILSNLVHIRDHKALHLKLQAFALYFTRKSMDLSVERGPAVR